MQRLDGLRQLRGVTVLDGPLAGGQCRRGGGVRPVQRGGIGAASVRFADSSGRDRQWPASLVPMAGADRAAVSAPLARCWLIEVEREALVAHVGPGYVRVA